MPSGNAATANLAQTLPFGEEKRASWRLIFRIARWTAYAVALVLLLLLLHKSPAPSVEIDAEAADQAEAKFQQVQTASLHGEKATLRMNEAELNSYLASNFDFTGNNEDVAPDATPVAFSDRDGQESAPTERDAGSTPSSMVRDLRVQLNEDRAQVYALWDVHGKDITVQIEGKLGAENGYLKFEPKCGVIGSLPIPQSTLQLAVWRLMGSPKNHEKFRLAGNVSDLRVENSEVVVQYQSLRNLPESSVH